MFPLQLSSLIRHSHPILKLQVTSKDCVTGIITVKHCTIVGKKTQDLKLAFYYLDI